MTPSKLRAVSHVAHAGTEHHLTRDEAARALALMVSGRELRSRLSQHRRQARVPERPDAVCREGLEVGMALALGQADALFAPARYVSAHLARGVPAGRLVAIARGDAEIARKVPRGAPSVSVGASATVPDLVPMAVGAALAAGIRARDRVVVAPCDRETLAASYPELRLARDRRLPLVLVLDDRAEDDPFVAGEAVAGVAVAAVAAADVEAIFGAVRLALTQARDGSGPVCIACRDIEVQEGPRHRRFRPLERELVTDPLALFVSRLSAHGLSRADLGRIVAEARQDAAAAFERGLEPAPRGADPLLDPSAGVLEVQAA